MNYNEILNFLLGELKLYAERGTLGSKTVLLDDFIKSLKDSNETVIKKISIVSGLLAGSTFDITKYLLDNELADMINTSEDNEYKMELMLSIIEQKDVSLEPFKSILLNNKDTLMNYTN